jgi:molecular chaperone GrpE
MTEGDDLVFEDANEEGEPLEAANPAATIKRLREKLKVCQKERQEFLEASQRLKADYVNARREEEKNREATLRFAKADLLEELLELADSFELAFQNREAWEKVDENWRRGVEYIYAKLEDIFRRNDLVVIDPLGQPFNPEEHHSRGHLPAETAADEGRVLAVTQKGYKMNGRIIRPASVKVGQGEISNN